MLKMTMRQEPMSGRQTPNRRFRPKADPCSVNAREADAFAANVLPIIREIQASKVMSYRGIAAALNARAVRTARGGEWSAMQVGRILERVA